MYCHLCLKNSHPGVQVLRQRQALRQRQDAQNISTHHLLWLDQHIYNDAKQDLFPELPPWLYQIHYLSKHLRNRA